MDGRGTARGATAEAVGAAGEALTRGRCEVVLPLRRGSERPAVFPRTQQVHDRLINLSFVERLHLDIRHHVAAVGRRVSTCCQGEDGLRQQLAVYHVYHNFVLPHSSLRQPLPQPGSTNGSGSAKRWRPYTLAIAAGLTDRGWSRRDALRYRVPPWPQPRAL